ncbi:hypothetical protein HOY34_03910 [Xinfangfangia sp. D13-10-4-6]|uniref:hypothetical protein n=1 Tax=Pseudogemmobacter hezensis TaxID=2737662 RepID=UPI001551976A|nr:hypothetical protein [Pseudogemmobacter hezensis]NPD14345.1 hypothetical protein [Pseudogemmobacter hezensis]
MKKLILTLVSFALFTLIGGTLMLLGPRLTGFAPPATALATGGGHTPLPPAELNEMLAPQLNAPRLTAQPAAPGPGVEQHVLELTGR